LIRMPRVVRCTVAELATIPVGNAGGLSGGLSIDMANRGSMLSLSLFDYMDDVMAARDRPIDFSDITGYTHPPSHRSQLQA